MGHCQGSGGPRVFRLDRMTSVALLDEGFEIPGDFDPASYIDSGRVYRSGQDVEVEVRYSPRIVRWIEEQGPVTRLEDGSVVARYPVGDPTWLVKHVLQYACDAEVVGPPEMRQHTRGAIERVLGWVAENGRGPEATGAVGS